MVVVMEVVEEDVMVVACVVGKVEVDVESVAGDVAVVKGRGGRHSCRCGGRRGGCEGRCVRH